MRLFSRILLIIVIGAICSAILIFGADAIDATKTVVLYR